jgi:hypothetical protein
VWPEGWVDGVWKRVEAVWEGGCEVGEQGARWGTAQVVCEGLFIQQAVFERNLKLFNHRKDFIIHISIQFMKCSVFFLSNSIKNVGENNPAQKSTHGLCLLSFFKVEVENWSADWLYCNNLLGIFY